MIGRYHTRRNVPVRPSLFSFPSIRRAVRGICHGHGSERAMTLVQLRVVMAGLDHDLIRLDPANHVLATDTGDAGNRVDARVKPGQARV